jgi:hypothetical protein
LKAALIQSVIFYGTGFGMAALSYAIVGNPYIHAPGLHHIIVFSTLVIGLAWTIASIFLYYFKAKTKKTKYVIIINTIILSSCFLYILYLINIK